MNNNLLDKKLIDNISLISKNLDKIYNFDNKNKVMYASMKLSEEVGELTSEVLKKLKIARKAKIDKFKQNELEGELADVILSALVLADSMNIDVNKALFDKLDKIEKRGGI